MSEVHDMIFNMLMEQKQLYQEDSPPDYKQRRKEEFERVTEVPENIHQEDVHLGNVSGEKLWMEKNPKDKVILHIHGGGFVGGSSKSSRLTTTCLVQEAGYNVISIDYRLAPEHPFPAAPEDCLEAYRFLEQEYGGSNIVIMGGSAGGNLVLATVLMAKDAGLKLPACVIAGSPVVQCDQEFTSHIENLNTDCMIGYLNKELQDQYFQTKDINVLRNPYGAPLYGDLSDFPPTLLIASESEVLRDDSVYFHNALDQFGIPNILSLYPGMMHSFSAFPMIPEALQALEEAKGFLKQYFS